MAGIIRPHCQEDYTAARGCLREIGLAMPKTAVAEMRGVLDRIKALCLGRSGVKARS